MLQQFFKQKICFTALICYRHQPYRVDRKSLIFTNFGSVFSKLARNNFHFKNEKVNPVYTLEGHSHSTANYGLTICKKKKKKKKGFTHLSNRMGPWIRVGRNQEWSDAIGSFHWQLLHINVNQMVTLLLHPWKAEHLNIIFRHWYRVVQFFFSGREYIFFLQMGKKKLMFSTTHH